MKLYYSKGNDPIYYVQLSYRDKESHKSTTKNIYRIGKHSELLKKYSDPLAYAKEYVEKVNKEAKEGKLDLSIALDLSKEVETNNQDKKNNVGLPIISLRTDKNIGYFFLQKIYKDLNIKNFFKDISKKYKITFNMNDINRFLVFERILDPRSKFKTLNSLNDLYESFDIDYQHICRFLDVLYENYDPYLVSLFKGSNNIIKRNTSICYYDCTNFYFEIEKQDIDQYDEVTGELIEGFRKYHVSKEHRPNPLVSMGLFMDKDGIPITMSIDRGNKNEQLTAKPLEEKMIKMFQNKKLIYCADAGLGSINNRLYNSFKDRAFIVSQSIKMIADKYKEAIFNDYDYRLLSNNKKVSIEELKTFDRFDINNLPLYNDFAYKVISIDRAVDLGLYEFINTEDGKTKKIKSKATLKQFVIVTFSRKSYEYQRTIRNNQIERAKKMINNNGVDSHKKGLNDVARFIKKAKDNKDTYVLDEEKIKEEEKYDGYYALATNINIKSINDVKSIININANRYKIEDCFRVIKTNFNGRPVFHRNKEHIVAHFLICYTALLIERLLEIKLEKNGYHFTINQLIDTIKVLNITNFENIFYKVNYTNSKILQSLSKLFDIDLTRENYMFTTLDNIIKKIS